MKSAKKEERIILWANLENIKQGQTNRREFNI